MFSFDRCDSNKWLSQGARCSLKSARACALDRWFCAAADASLQVEGIFAVFQHLLVIIGFQEGGPALLKMTDHFLTGFPDIGEHADLDPFEGYDKTMRLGGVVELGKGGDG